jgi:hypothetical protein
MVGIEGPQARVLPMPSYVGNMGIFHSYPPRNPDQAAPGMYSPHPTHKQYKSQMLPNADPLHQHIVFNYRLQLLLQSH